MQYSSAINNMNNQAKVLMYLCKCFSEDNFVLNETIAIIIRMCQTSHPPLAVASTTLGLSFPMMISPLVDPGLHCLSVKRCGSTNETVFWKIKLRKKRE